MGDLPWTGDEAFRRELTTLSKARLTLQVSAGALIAIVSASHVVDGLMRSTMASKTAPLFGLTLGLHFATHYLRLLIARRSTWP